MAKNEFEPRRAEGGMREVSYTSLEGKQVTLRAGDDGVFQPKDELGKLALDSLDLPVARSAMAESKAAEKPDKGGE